MTTPALARLRCAMWPIAYTAHWITPGWKPRYAITSTAAGHPGRPEPSRHAKHCQTCRG